jgi:hypothetical protein
VSNDFAFLSVAKNKDVVMVVNEIWMAACLSVLVSHGVLAASSWCHAHLLSF